MNEKGFVLIFTLLIIFCITVLAMSMAFSTSLESKMVANYKQKIQVFYSSQQLILSYKQTGRITEKPGTNYELRPITYNKKLCHQLIVGSKNHHACSTIEAVFCGDEQSMLSWREIN